MLFVFDLDFERVGAETSKRSKREYSQGWSFRNRGRRVGRSRFLTEVMRNGCETLIFDSNF